MADGAVLIGCVKQKRDRRSRAAELYTSPLFDRRRAYAEASGLPWFVISALYGLVPPYRVVDPYELAITDLDSVAQRRWALRVALELETSIGTANNQLVEVHAGAAYVEPLRRAFRATSFAIVTPLKGMGIGQQLHWYNGRLS